MNTLYLLVIVWSGLLTIFALYVGFRFSIIQRDLEAQDLKRKIAELEADEWREKLLDKVKEKIAITEQARNRITQGEDLVAKFIYHQQGIEELSTELFGIYSKPIAAIKKKYPDLTELDLLVLCLLGIGMDNVEICSILRMEKRTLYRRRQLIVQRIGIQGSANLEPFARAMIEETDINIPQPEQQAN